VRRKRGRNEKGIPSTLGKSLISRENEISNEAIRPGRDKAAPLAGAKDER